MTKHTPTPWYATKDPNNEGYHIQSAKINEDNYVFIVDCEADTVKQEGRA